MNPMTLPGPQEQNRLRFEFASLILLMYKLYLCPVVSPGINGFVIVNYSKLMIFVKLTQWYHLCGNICDIHAVNCCLFENELIWIELNKFELSWIDLIWIKTGFFVPHNNIWQTIPDRRHFCLIFFFDWPHQLGN